MAIKKKRLVNFNQSVIKNGVPHFEVERIIDSQYLEDGKIHYLIKWKHWDDQYNSWEPVENLKYSMELVANYLDRR